ncbi:type IV secretory system conjugative DNA transfer family protein [Streptomyces sp. H39-S7]|uniref:type IV secretory system conjugative DNA transfer family protein n=1 Tax=Streptomyces sp. H39-S7 TaxID=3004357 RepID=UPI0022AFCE46|nr:type IV secretory system conjugative DNA transfer family protein [Streptomyces sp. H39-S7]MCZ4120906.1 type IV secretory system conjugative DNA transfer family protein [Streptomyces sp. H39-S7]
MTIMVWTATGIAGLFAHGSWPTAVHFTRTPLAMRHLMGDPHDIPGAWPESPPLELPGSGLFWGIFIGQLMVLFVLTVFLIGVLTRYRVVRANHRAARETAESERSEDADAVPAPRRHKPEPEPAVAVEQRPPAPEPPREPAPAPAVPTAYEAPPAVPVPAPIPHQAPEPQTAPAAHALPPVAPPARTDPLAGGELRRTYVLFAAPRGDKAKRAVEPAILNAAGAVIVTTADAETYRRTVGNRAKLGPVSVYDPAHLIDLPGRLRWAPHTGCEDAPKAATRATALLAPLRPTSSLDSLTFAAAETLLRCWLHAAAVDGLPFRQVHRWAAGGAAGGEAVRILRTARTAAAGWSGELESVLHAHPERRDAAQALIHRGLECLNSIHIRDACNPGRAGAPDWESFVAERGTLYVVGEAIEDPRARPGAMPLLTALVSSVVEHGRSMAARSSAGRLDPPITLVLDDIAALAPIPELPGLLSTGQADGLPVLAVFRSPEQARDRWRTALWQQADVRLTLGDPLGLISDEIPDAVQLG